MSLHVSRIVLAASLLACLGCAREPVANPTPGAASIERTLAVYESDKELEPVLAKKLAEQVDGVGLCRVTISVTNALVLVWLSNPTAHRDAVLQKVAELTVAETGLPRNRVRVQIMRLGSIPPKHRESLGAIEGS